MPARGGKRGKPWRKPPRAKNPTPVQFKENNRKRPRSTSLQTDDAIDDDFNQQEPLPVNQKSEEKKRITMEKNRNAKRQRKHKHDKERADTEAAIRAAPHQLLWSKYVEWASKQDPPREVDTEQWTEEQVHFCIEQSQPTLIEHVKEIMGSDYVAQGQFKKGSKVTPGVACIALGLSGQRAVKMAPMLYDGKPVGKLFGTHFKIEDQRLWLNRYRSKGLVPTAVGTAKRVQRLVEEGHLTMKHTVAVIIDFARNDGERNILDISTMRDELFDFIHHHARPRMAEGSMKLILCAPDAPKAEKEDGSTSE